MFIIDDEPQDFEELAAGKKLGESTPEAEQAIDDAMSELFGDAHKFAIREPNRFERRCDFANIKNSLDTNDQNISLRMRAAFKDALGNLLKWFDRRGKSLSPELIRDFRFDTGFAMKAAIKDLYLSTWDYGKQSSGKELGEDVKARVFWPPRYFSIHDAYFKPVWALDGDQWENQRTWASYAVDGPGFEPDEALAAFEGRAWLIKGVVDARLQAEIQIELFQHLQGGRTMGETMQRMRDILEPYIGDPTAITPTGMTGIGFPPGVTAPENILMAYRLENIIRTESTWAYNQGRLATGQEAGDYVLGYAFSAILDERTTITCQTADGLILQKDDPRTIKLTPPVHFQCRSLLSFVTSDDVPIEWSDDDRIDAAVALIPKGFN